MAKPSLIASLALGAAIPVSLMSGAVWAQDTRAEQLIPLSELKARQAQRGTVSGQAGAGQGGTGQAGTGSSQFPTIEDPSIMDPAPRQQAPQQQAPRQQAPRQQAPQQQVPREAPINQAPVQAPVADEPVIIEAPLPAEEPMPQPEPAPASDPAPVVEAPVEAPAAAPQTDRPKARQTNVSMTPSAIDQALYSGGPLPEGATPLGVKVQVLLDRAGISPGVVDGVKGGMTESALKAFEEQQSLPVDGQMDLQVWAALGGDTAAPITSTYTITAQDTEGLSAPLPSDYAELAELDQLGFTRVSERLAEDFHMDEDFLKRLNPGASFRAGETLTVVETGQNQDTVITRIELDKSSRRLRAFDAAGRMITNYPVTIGSATTPSPSGTHTVTAVAPNPNYTYNPKVNFTQGDNKEVLILPPGPNGPVGSTWIDLSKPTYGIHGTANPTTLFKAASNGCVRLTNWDAKELSKMVREGTTVTFME